MHPANVDRVSGEMIGYREKRSEVEQLYWFEICSAIFYLMDLTKRCQSISYDWISCHFVRIWWEYVGLEYYMINVTTLN